MRHDSVVSRYVIPIGIPQVDGWSTGPPGFGASHVRIKTSCPSSLSNDSTKVDRVAEAINGFSRCGLSLALISTVRGTGVVSEEARRIASDVCRLPSTEQSHDQEQVSDTFR